MIFVQLGSIQFGKKGSRMFIHETDFTVEYVTKPISAFHYDVIFSIHSGSELFVFTPNL